jgi:hypothetical protein
METRCTVEARVARCRPDRERDVCAGERLAKSARPQSAAHTSAAAGRSSVLQLVFASGATLRIETGALDGALVCALVAELQR